MNYESGMKSAMADVRGPMVERGGLCRPETNQQQITSKCREIFEMSISVASVAETIRGKLFGPQPQPTGELQEPYSIDDILDNTRNVLITAIKTLQEINERT
jgi:hypothetical protein